MKKETNVKAHTRRTKSGKTVTVKAHTQKYDAAEEAQKALKKKKGAGKELESRRNDVSIDDFQIWWNWDGEHTKENSAAIKVERALIKKLGDKAYKKFYSDVADSWTKNGYKKSFESLSTMGNSKVRVDNKKVSNKSGYSSEDLESWKSFTKVQRSSMKRDGEVSNPSMLEKHKSGYDKIERLIGKSGLGSISSQNVRERILKGGSVEDAITFVKKQNKDNEDYFYRRFGIRI